MTDAPVSRCSSGRDGLRHCCFCTSEMVQVVFGIGAVYHVECPSCLASGPHAKNEATAAEAWNRYPLNVAQAEREPDSWQWRACIGGQWGAWLDLDWPVERFRERNKFNFDNGTYELRPLYAGPALSSTSRVTGLVLDANSASGYSVPSTASKTRAD